MSHADLVKERDSAQREASGLRARVIKSESRANAPTIPGAKLAEAMRDRDRYPVLIQSVASQVQGLQDSYADIAIRAEFSQYSLRDFIGPLLGKIKLSSLSQ